MHKFEIIEIADSFERKNSTKKAHVQQSQQDLVKYKLSCGMKNNKTLRAQLSQLL